MRVGRRTLTSKSTLIAGTTARKLCHCASISTVRSAVTRFRRQRAPILAEIVESAMPMSRLIDGKITIGYRGRAKSRKASLAISQLACPFIMLQLQRIFYPNTNFDNRFLNGNITISDCERKIKSSYRIEEKGCLKTKLNKIHVKSMHY